MKKILALLLALAMVFALAACGSNSDSAADDENNDAEETVDTEEAAEEAGAPEDTADAAVDLDGYKAYVNAYAAAGAPDEDEAAAVAATVNACTTIEEIEAVSQLTVLYENVGMLYYEDWVAAGKPEADTEGTVSEAEQQGGASGEGGSGEAASIEVEVIDPSDYDADVVAAYAEYLHEWLLAEVEVNDEMTEDVVENEFMPLIEAGDYYTFPAEMLWGTMLVNGNPMNLAEFAAQY